MKNRLLPIASRAIHTILRASLFLIVLTVWGGTWNVLADTKAEPDYDKLIAGLEKTILARKHKIEFLKFKQALHEECLCSCKYRAHKNSARGDFYGNPYKVCHQHPAGEKHNSGVTQAITSLQRKIDALELSVEVKEQKLADLKRKAAAAGRCQEVTELEKGAERDDEQIIDDELDID